MPSQEIRYGVRGEARYIRLMITTPVIIMAMTAAKPLALVRELQKLTRPSARSYTEKRRILKRLLPITLPMARSMAPRRTAARLAAISGREVEVARKRFPTKLLESPVVAESRSPIEESQIPSRITATALAMKIRNALPRE